MGKSENKTIFLSFDVTKSVIFDNEVVTTKRTERLIFMSWQRTHLQNSSYRQKSDSTLRIRRTNFIYKDGQNNSLCLGYYDKDDKKVYETFRISPGSESFDFLKELMDDYAIRSDGEHIEDYKAFEVLGYEDSSQVVNASATPFCSDEMPRKAISYYGRQGLSLYKNDENEFFAYYKHHDNSKGCHLSYTSTNQRMHSVCKFINNFF